MSYPQPEKHGGFTLIVTATIQPDKVDEWLSIFWPAFERVSNEPECLSFELFRYPDEPNKVKWVENWSKSKEWFLEVSSCCFFFFFFFLSRSHPSPYLTAISIFITRIGVPVDEGTTTCIHTARVRLIAASCPPSFSRPMFYIFFSLFVFGET